MTEETRIFLRPASATVPTIDIVSTHSFFILSVFCAVNLLLFPEVIRLNSVVRVDSVGCNDHLLRIFFDGPGTQVCGTSCFRVPILTDHYF